MMFHTIVYQNTAVGVNAVDTDMSAATDTVLTTRGSTPHYTMTVPFRIGKGLFLGANATRSRLFTATWNGYGRFGGWSANRSATVPSNPQYDDFMPAPLRIPLNEEMQVQASNNLGASTEAEEWMGQLLTDDWNPQVPAGEILIPVEFTVTVTPTLNAWSGAQAITLVQTLRNGVYSVVGGICQGANSFAWRLIFPTQKPYMGKFLRPGDVVQNAVGDVHSNQRTPWVFEYGEWGRFHTFELPQVEFFGLAANSTTYRIWLYCVYLGKELTQLTGWANQGSMQVTM